MKHFIATSRLSFPAALLLAVVGSCQVTQARDTDWIGPAAGANWNTSANWLAHDSTNMPIAPPLNIPPDSDFNEAAEITNGATVILNTHTMSAAAPGNPLTPTDVAGLRLGEAAAETGGLEIRNGGIMRNIVGNPPTVGEALETGAIQVGINGRGILSVLGGGLLTGGSFASAGTANTSVTLGDTSGLTATVTISSLTTPTTPTTGAANFGRITTVVGPNVNFNATGNLTLGGTGTLVADIRNATTHSALKADGNATVGGTVRPMFTGVTPAAGNRWRLVDVAGTVTGTFSTIDKSALSLPVGLDVTVVPGTNGARTTRDLLVEEVLVLQVNRSTGAVSIANVGAANKNIDGYSILSPNGWLTGTWNSLDDQNLGGANAWVEAGPTPTALSELNPAQVAPGFSTVNAATSLNLGTPYAVNNATFPPLGTDPDNLVFEYSGPDGRTIQGQIVYSGTRVVNDLILNVDPATGAVALRNDSPHTIQLDGYNITSASGSLVPGSWNSLDDQNVAGWEEASLTANNLTELKPTSGLLTLTPGTGFSLGNAFATAGATQDLTIGFLQAGNELFTDGTVVYGAFTAPPNPGAGGLTGDYNNNGTVDAADYVLWRNGGPLMNDSTPAGVGPEDYGVWRANFGRTAGPGSAAATAVPEPSSVLLLCMASIGLVWRDRQV